MIGGTYTIVLKTPMGAKKGELWLEEHEGVLTGRLTALGEVNELHPGRCDAGRFDFAGELKTAVGRVAFTCSGSVDGDRILAVAKSTKGDIKITGERKA